MTPAFQLQTSQIVHQLPYKREVKIICKWKLYMLRLIFISTCTLHNYRNNLLPQNFSSQSKIRTQAPLDVCAI
ncbi:hypothetical protein CIPAW_10G037000 [Carya illinoinensis]|uniref:Uncharacterized protein n=1 Tax=Carya illinoinensis TaxID=32201 RepID=A0A8T1P759_CARIL|nr:hypothetical protein CIPAW_10G037000 [Carya illinoinensis]